MSRRKHICCSLRAPDGTEFVARVSPDIDQRTIDLLAKVFQSAYQRALASLPQMTTDERKQQYKSMPEIGEDVRGKYMFDPGKEENEE